MTLPTYDGGAVRLQPASDTNRQDTKTRRKDFASLCLGGCPKLRGQRGSTLIVTVMLLVVVTIFSLSLVRRNTSQADATAAKRHYDETVSCADGARQMLLGQMSIYGVSPLEMVLDRSLGSTRYNSGHYDNFAVTTVTLARGTPNNGIGVSDIANRIITTPLGGQVYRYTVVCMVPPGDGGPAHQDEVEYLVRFGL